MRTLLSLVLPFCLLLPACGEKAANAGTGTDLMNIADDAAKQTGNLDQVKSTAADLMKALGSITDGSTAEAAKGKLEGLVTGLKSQLGDLGDGGKLSASVASMKDAVLKPVLDKVSSLMSNAEIQQAIGPVLDKLKGLIGSGS